MSFEISSRRYLGNKYKLNDFIRKIADTECKNINTVFDAFAGTGAVSYGFKDKILIVNDLMYSNYITAVAWFSPQEYSMEKMQEYINIYNKKSYNKDNYMSKNFANTYFSENVCKKIGAVREDIEKKYNKNLINEKERAILITALIYAMDKNANTCGHYDSFIQGADYSEDFVLQLPSLDFSPNKANRCLNGDANQIAIDVECDLAYLDPPYNSRQYCDAYHLLENVSLWNKPEVVGVARKMDRSKMKSLYCKTTAASALEDLVNKLKCRYIMLSYNNNGDKFQIRSNAKISDEQIMDILSKKGEVSVFTTDYKAFSAGKSQNDKNQERVFLCKVRN